MPGSSSHWVRLVAKPVGRNVLLALIIALLPFLTVAPTDRALAAPTPPRWATSHYMKTVNPTTLYNLAAKHGVSFTFDLRSGTLVLTAKDDSR